MGKRPVLEARRVQKVMHPDKPAHTMVRAGLELLGLRLAVEADVNGPFLWPRLPRLLGPQERVLLQN